MPIEPQRGVAIRIRGLHKSFGGNHVLRGVDLDIPRGRITTLIGASGSGKSVLAKHIVGLVKPDSGCIEVEGREVTGRRRRELIPIRRRIGLVFQHAALFDSMTVEENICFPLQEHARMRRAEIRRRVDELLERLHLPGIHGKLPAELSGGMRKRVGLARAMILEPEIMLYDEPTTGLDPLMIREVDDMILEAQEEFGVTSLVISHDMASTFRLSHKIAMLHEGVIRLEGSPELFRETDDEHVAEFVYAISTAAAAQQEARP